MIYFSKQLNPKPGEAKTKSFCHDSRILEFGCSFPSVSYLPNTQHLTTVDSLIDNVEDWINSLNKPEETIQVAEDAKSKLLKCYKKQPTSA